MNIAMALGQLDTTLPFIKKVAVQALTQPYATETEAMQKIATALHAKYSGDPRYHKAIDQVQKIYRIATTFSPR
ncbi:MAG: hypothetical protein NTV49_14885 [Kiritimatiellaeota bacterium]|nr:hypothetical protein [Kiritimatiellota bacterium]